MNHLARLFSIHRNIKELHKGWLRSVFRDIGSGEKGEPTIALINLKVGKVIAVLICNKEITS